MSIIQVDCNNFHSVYSQVQEVLAKADFIAFDCEFTGLITCLDKIEGIFPNHLQFYERIKQTANNFALLQVGLTAFILEQKMYKPITYNFYIEPRSQTPGKNKIVLCEVESLEFLAKNGMDFKQAFTKGICSKQLKSKYQVLPHQNIPTPKWNCAMFFNQFDKKVIYQIEAIIQKFLLKQNSQSQGPIDFMTANILQYFRNKYEREINITDRTKHMGKNQFTVRKNIKLNDINEKKQDKNENFGFQKIIEKIILFKKPIVGHFPNLDIGLIYAHFIEDLPQSFIQFTDRLNGYFPYIFDTKVISFRIQQKLKYLKVDLSGLFSACLNQKILRPFTNILELQNHPYTKQKHCHQAGYDSFITGCAFLGMCKYMVQQKQGRIDFQLFDNQNKIIYSRDAGQINLKGLNYCSKASDYPDRIIIGNKTNIQEQAKIAEILSQFGTLLVYEDHNEIYYVFEKPNSNIKEIMYLHPGLKLRYYNERKIIKASDIFNNNIYNL